MLLSPVKTRKTIIFNICISKSNSTNMILPYWQKCFLQECIIIQYTVSNNNDFIMIDCLFPGLQASGGTDNPPPYTDTENQNIFDQPEKVPLTN